MTKALYMITGGSLNETKHLHNRAIMVGIFPYSVGMRQNMDQNNSDCDLLCFANTIFRSSLNSQLHGLLLLLTVKEDSNL